MRLRAALTAIAATAATLLPVSPATAVTAPCAREIVSLQTFHIELKVAKKTYEIGDTVIIDGVVKRPAHEDPAGAGIPMEPPHSVPAEDTNLAIGLGFKRIYLPGYSRTNDDGESRFRLKLPRYATPGPVNVDAYAWEKRLESPCLTVEEVGYRHYPALFKVTG